MSDTRLEELMDLIVERWRAIDATSPYLVDLTKSDDQVTIGEADPSIFPCVQLLLDIDGETSPGVSLQNTTEKVRIPFRAFVQAKQSNEDRRGRAALLLLSDLKRKLRDDPQLAGNCDFCWIPRYMVLSAGLERLPNAGVVQGFIEITYELERGM